MDFHVYQIPMSTVNGTLSQLYLGDYKAVPISKKWPKLYADARFQQLLKHRSMLLDVYTCVDNYDEYVLFETDRANEANAVMYGLNTQYVGTGTAYQLSDKHLSFISSESMNDFYQLTKTPGSHNGDMTLMRWHFNLRPGDKGIRSVAPRHGHAASPDLPEDLWYRICAVGSDKLTVQRNKGAPCKAVSWPILTGFVANKQFYLFGKSYVFVFSEAAYSTAGANVDLKKVPYNEFIRCGGDGQGRMARLAKRKFPL